MRIHAFLLTIGICIGNMLHVSRVHAAFTSKTDVVITTNDKTTEYHSDKPENYEYKSEDGSVNISVKNSANANSSTSVSVENSSTKTSSSSPSSTPKPPPKADQPLAEKPTPVSSDTNVTGEPTRPAENNQSSGFSFLGSFLQWLRSFFFQS